MKTLLVAVNSKYIHTNPAVYYLRSAAGVFHAEVQIKEFTINQNPDDILYEIYRVKPEFIGFSCYIWNIKVISQLIPACKKLLPECKIWLGGPEAENNSGRILKAFPEIEGIMCGEGESVFPVLLKNNGAASNHIPGIIYLNGTETVKTAAPELIELDTIPFPYGKELLKELEGKIIYYESSRGCPYQCSYCLSSNDNKVRFRSTEKVKEDLSVFLKNNCRQVKFVDRSFNCNHKRMKEILRFIAEHDNGITNFHFEINAEILDEEELLILSQLRTGAVQLEIGVQTTNPDVLKKIHRSTDTERLFKNVKRLREYNKQHIHLDLIAGLPKEDILSFRNSFNEVYALHPDQLQLGFLKVLGNTLMSKEAEEYGIVYRNHPPYEVLMTDNISYEQLNELKRIEEMTDIYYNSGQFRMELQFAENLMRVSEKCMVKTAYDFYGLLAEEYMKQYSFGMQSSRMAKYEVLLGVLLRMLESAKNCPLEEYEKQMLIQLALFDCYARERKKARPGFAKDAEDEIRRCKLKNADLKAMECLPENHLEYFDIDVKKTAESGRYTAFGNITVFDYEKRSAITGNAEVRVYSCSEEDNTVL